MEDYNLLLKKYNFITRFDYIKGNNELCGKMSKIYLLEDKHSHKKYICKRLTEKKYRENEWKLPQLIIKNNPSSKERIIDWINIYYRNNKQLYYYLVCEYNNEKDLFSHIYNIKFNEHKIKRFVHLMALCIKDCHDNNIIHLDIKTENFILTSKNPLKIKLLDFGFSIQYNEHENKPFIHLNKAYGTPFYIAPEVLYDKKCCFSSDVYSLGAIIVYFLFSKLNPEKDGIRLFRKQLILSPKLSEPFKDIVLKMTDKNPTTRPTIKQIVHFFSS